MNWWRSHSLRISLTLWNVAAMILVLAVYAAGERYPPASMALLETEQAR